MSNPFGSRDVALLNPADNRLFVTVNDAGKFGGGKKTTHTVMYDR